MGHDSIPRRSLRSGGPLVVGLAAVVLLAAFSGPARAYVAFGYSLEWLCVFSPVIVVAEVGSVMDHEKSRVGDRTHESARLECVVTEALKGKAEERIRFAVSGYSPVGKKGTRYLLFLDKREKTMEVVYWINLGSPARSGTRGAGYTKKGGVLTDEKSILGLVRTRLKARPLPPRVSSQFPEVRNSFRILAPGAAAEALYARSSTYLHIPPDAEFEKTFLAAARVVAKEGETAPWDHHSASAMLALSYYPTKAAIARLREGLRDGRHERYALNEEGKPRRVVRLYLVRQAAYEALRMMGEEVERPEHFCECYYESGGGWGFRDPTTLSKIPFERLK